MVLDNVASLKHVVPEALLAGGVVVVLLADLVRKTSRGVSAAITLFALAGSAVALAATADGESRGLFGGLLARDPFADFWKVLFLVVTALVGVVALRSRETISHQDGDGDAAEFYALTLTVCLGLFLMAGAADLLMVYLSLELVSILSYVLAGFKRPGPDGRRSAEAALKYVIYGGVASGAMLYGFSLLYGMAGSTSLSAIQQAAVVQKSQATLIIAVALSMVGFGYKVASVPFHMWCPDVYEGAPTPVTAFLSVGPKAAGFALLLRFFTEAIPGEGQPWPIMLGVVAVATMTLGNLVALVQDNVKRMLAYSSIAHAGYVMLGLVAGSPQGDGPKAMMFYLAVYLFMNLGAFAVVTALIERGMGETVADLKGLGYRAPMIGLAMAIFLFSLTGLPPTAGFAGKFLLFAALLAKGGTFMVALALIGVLNSAISLYYYARLLKAMYLEKPDDASLVHIARSHGWVVGAMAVPIVVLGVFWGPLQGWTDQAFRLWAAG